MSLRVRAWQLGRNGKILAELSTDAPIAVRGSILR